MQYNYVNFPCNPSSYICQYKPEAFCLSCDKTWKTKGRPTQNQEQGEENMTRKDGGDVTNKLEAMDNLQASIRAIHK